jgi:hypothetical protein
VDFFDLVLNPTEMLRVQMAFACEDVASESGGPVTFKNVIDGMMAPDFPAPTGRWFAIFSFFNDEPQQFGNCRVVIEHEKGELVAQKAIRDVSFTPRDPISRNVVSFQGLSWPYPGGYLVKLVAERDEILAYFPIWVAHSASPT